MADFFAMHASDKRVADVEVEAPERSRAAAGIYIDHYMSMITVYIYVTIYIYIHTCMHVFLAE